MTDIRLKLLRVGGAPRTTPWNGQQIAVWEGDAIEMFAQYYQADRGVLLTFTADLPDQFSSLPSPYASASEMGSAWDLNLATRNNSIKDGDRIVNVRFLEERSAYYQDFSILIMDDDFGLSGPTVSTQQPNNGSTPTPQGIPQGNVTTINGNGNTVVNGSGNTVNTTTTVINNVTNNINNGTINNFNFSVGSINIDLSGALQGASKGTDSVAGTSGDDVIASGVGKDILTGNEGADTFALNTEDKFGKNGADTITDFDSAAGDKIVVDPEVFPGSELGVAPSNRDAKKMQTKSFDYIYNQSNGQLFYDANGAKKGFGDGGLIAFILGSPQLTQENFALLA